MYAKVNIMENEETGKPLHEFYKSLVLGDLGEAVIDTMCTMGIMDGEYKSTLKGDKSGKWSKAAIFSFYATKNIFIIKLM